MISTKKNFQPRLHKNANNPFRLHVTINTEKIHGHEGLIVVDTLGSIPSAKRMLERLKNIVPDKQPS